MSLKQVLKPAAATRRRLVQAALRTLKERGFDGATARGIAASAGLNQALVFYHFGSVQRLLLEALEATSQERLKRYRDRLKAVATLPELVDAMAALYQEDVRSGHITAVQEMVAGASFEPELRRQIVARMEPWVAFAEEVLGRVVGGTVLETVLPVHDLAFAAVAFYFGIETVTHLDGDRRRADALFRAGRQVADVADAILRSATWVGDRS
jgi:AcrR family transcriptional regulator